MHFSKSIRSESLWDTAKMLWVCGTAILLLPGCRPQRAAPVDAELARATLVQVLEHWKQGGTIDQLRSQSPEIVVQEAFWSSGRVLEDFTLVGTGRKEDANWFCEVELALAPAAGSRPVKKKVTYVIGTDPVLTVFRAIL